MWCALLLEVHLPIAPTQKDFFSLSNSFGTCITNEIAEAEVMQNVGHFKDEQRKLPALVKFALNQPQPGWQWTPRDQPREYYYRPRHQGRSYGGGWRHGGYYRRHGYYRLYNGGYVFEMKK